MHWLDLDGRAVEAAIPELSERLAGLAPAKRADPVAATTATRKRRFSERVLDALLALPPPIVGVALAAVGGLLTLLSALIGVAEFEYRLEHEGAVVAKEVGFLWALNWSLCLIVVYPAIAGIGLQALREMAALPERLVKRRMMIDAGFRTARIGFVENEIRAALRVGSLAALILLPAFLGYAIWEFQEVVGSVYAGDAFPKAIALDHPMKERDWSVAALLPAVGDGPNRTANYAFAFSAYIWLVGFGSTLVLSIFIFFLCIAAAIYRISARTEGLRIVPDLRDPLGRREFDARCGFEIFRRLFGYSMIVALLSFVALYLVNLQNTYIRLPEAHLIDYILPNFKFPNGVAAELVGGGGRSTFDNLNGALSVGIGGLLFSMIVFGLAITLRLGARQAHDLMLERVEDQEEPLPVFLEETDREDALERLDAMRFWPVRWLGLNRLLTAIILAGLSLVFHRLGFFAVMLALLYVASATLGGDKTRR